MTLVEKLVSKVNDEIAIKTNTSTTKRQNILSKLNEKGFNLPTPSQSGLYRVANEVIDCIFFPCLARPFQSVGSLILQLTVKELKIFIQTELLKS